MARIVKESALLGAHEVSIENGRIAKQAAGSVLIQSGDTMVVVTACTKPCDREQDFFPLACESVEQSYAAGRLPGPYRGQLRSRLRTGRHCHHGSVGGFDVV